jgi:DNA polymerase delta subunit 1
MIHLKNRLIFPCMWVDEGISYCYYFVQPKRKFDKDGNIIQDEHGQDIIDFDDRAILPRILKMLLNTRKATKKRMKKEKDPFKKKILDGLQLAYKITANSIYGATGASVGCISCKKVAGSVTMVGRLLLATSRDKILDYYEGSKCVYGDTDSVFINFKVPDEIVNKHGLFSDKALDWTIKIAQESGELITHGIWKGKKELVPLPSPHDLEYEKTYLPFILFSKKRYAGWLYEFDTKEPKYLDCKGIILKRRDNCRFLKKIYEGCLYRILNNQLDDSISFLRKSLYDILNNHTLKKYPMSDFIISKTVKSLDKYKVNSKTQDILDQLYEKIDKLKLEDEEKNSKMIKILNEKVVYYELRKVNIAHVMLALRQKQRDPGNAFASNDRVPYCFIEVEGNQKDLLQGDIIETPAYITKEKISLDYLYYIERQLEKPIMQLFEQVDPRAAQLFKDIKRIGSNRKKNLTEITKFFIEVIESENSLISDTENSLISDTEEEIKSPKKVKKKKKKKKKKKSRIVLEEDSSSDIELPVRRRRKKKKLKKD